MVGFQCLHVRVHGSADEDQLAKRVALEERTEYASVITTEELCKKYVGNKEKRKPFIHESHEK